MNFPSDQLHDRDLRQREIVPPDQLATCHAVVLGVGAIGRQVALQLPAVGVPLLILYDHDTVAVENLAGQGYRPDQLGQNKADATALDCQRINPRTHTVPRAERFRRSTASQLTVGNSSLVVFSCVDSITTRRLTWEAVRFSAALFLDGRMSAEVIRVLAANEPAGWLLRHKSVRCQSGVCWLMHGPINHLFRFHCGGADDRTNDALAARPTS